MKPLETILLLLRLRHHEARHALAISNAKSHRARNDLSQATACLQTADHWIHRARQDLATWAHLTWITPLSA